MDANNLFPEFVWHYTANNTVNLSSPQNFGKFPTNAGYSFSNRYGTNGPPQRALRVAY
jgi:hypothetical protein